MTKENILKLIELKIALTKAEDTHRKDLDAARANGSYAYAEGYYSPAMKEIDRLSEEIDALN